MSAAASSWKIKLALQCSKGRDQITCDLHNELSRHRRRWFISEHLLSRPFWVQHAAHDEFGAGSDSVHDITTVQRSVPTAAAHPPSESGRTVQLSLIFGSTTQNPRTALLVLSSSADHQRQ
jgi:hypothetical protein